MEVSMGLKKKAVTAIAAAASMAVIGTAAQTAPVEIASAETAFCETDTDTQKTALPANGIAGIAAVMSDCETAAYEFLETACVQVEQTKMIRVASGEEAETQDINIVQESSQEEILEETVSQTLSEESDMPKEEEQLWENRLMADVNEFLYVRADASQEAEIVGKLYKGDVAEIKETGSEWTHVSSGNVDGYVKNDYCITGTDALTYAQENFDTEAMVQTNGLRVRSEADENSSVITAVSEGTTFQVDAQAQTDEDWVAVVHDGKTRYVSAEYVTTYLALGEGITIEEEREQQARIAAEEAAKKAAAQKEAAAAASAQTTQTTVVQNEAVSVSADDVTLLAAIIQCEAGNEIYEGQLAVGAVVMNRVRSGSYPNTVYDVIYQKGQFPPASSGMVANIIAKGPKQSCIQAAQEALNGTDNTNQATRFRRASSGQAGVVIGNHVFY